MPAAVLKLCFRYLAKKKKKKEKRQRAKKKEWKEKSRREQNKEDTVSTIVYPIEYALDGLEETSTIRLREWCETAVRALSLTSYLATRLLHAYMCKYTVDAEALLKERSAQSIIKSALLLCYGHGEPLRKRNSLETFYQQEFSRLEGVEGLRPAPFLAYSQVLGYEAEV